MYRQRLKSHSGCMRCKARHHKCDEERPRCLFCARHNLACVWPTVSQGFANGDRRSTPIDIRKPTNLGRGPARDDHRPQLDPFHVLPVHDRADTQAISTQLSSFFSAITQTTLPFDVQDVHQELSRGWLASVYADEAVCNSFITYTAWFYSERTPGDSKLKDLRLEYEARSLALLRHRVETGKAVTDGTLLTAVLHFFVATLNVQHVAQISQMARGISALIMAMGGPSATVASVTPSTKQSLIYADVFNALLTAQMPFLHCPLLPSKPSSFMSLSVHSTVDAELATCVGQELVEILQDMRFVLFLRHPSQQRQRLSAHESQYLFILLQKISYKLCGQQSRLMGTQSLAEITMYAMILVKEEVFLDIIQHPILPATILRRLHSAVKTCMLPIGRLSMTITLWASMMALTRTEFESDRTWALTYITGRLTERYGLMWPDDWVDQVRQDLQLVLWHDRVEAAFIRICASIVCLRKS